MSWSSRVFITTFVVFALFSVTLAVSVDRKRAIDQAIAGGQRGGGRPVSDQDFNELCNIGQVFPSGSEDDKQVKDGNKIRAYMGQLGKPARLGLMRKIWRHVLDRDSIETFLRAESCVYYLMKACVNQGDKDMLKKFGEDYVRKFFEFSLAWEKNHPGNALTKMVENIQRDGSSLYKTGDLDEIRVALNGGGRMVHDKALSKETEGDVRFDLDSDDEYFHTQDKNYSRDEFNAMELKDFDGDYEIKHKRSGIHRDRKYRIKQGSGNFASAFYLNSKYGFRELEDFRESFVPELMAETWDYMAKNAHPFSRHMHEFAEVGVEEVDRTAYCGRHNSTEHAFCRGMVFSQPFTINSPLHATIIRAARMDKARVLSSVEQVMDYSKMLDYLYQVFSGYLEHADRVTEPDARIFYPPTSKNDEVFAAVERFVHNVYGV
eukprot:GFYU01009575.1.p1 GENE.GFYU01009575.1~~GFYU01009575.1.p1  ORF type:complete len:433 (+),score=121.28 GFYU01009575.1:37-1335(+)